MGNKSKSAREVGWRQWTEQDARVALDELARSGASAAQFARDSGISPHQLAYWKRRLQDRALPAFVRVELPAVEASSSRLQVEIIAGGVVLRVREDVDAERLAGIVDALVRRQRSC